MKNICTFLMFLVPFVSIAQPVLLKNINPTTVDAGSHSFPTNAYVFNGQLYFSAHNFNGREPWKTNGTSNGTLQIRDISSAFSNSNSDPQFFNKVGNDLFFFCNNEFGGVKIYKVNGITNAITEVGYIDGSMPAEVVVCAGNLYFPGVSYNFLNEGLELLKFEISTGVLLSVADIRPGTDSSNPRNLTVKGDTIYFSANDGIHGTEPWLYNASLNAVQMIKDISNVGANSSNPYDFVIYNDSLFFSASNGIDGVELWKTKGDDLSTEMVANINMENTGADSSNPAHKTVFNNLLIFSAHDGLGGNELWKYTGTSGIAEMIADINLTTDSSSNPGLYGFTVSDGMLYFAADDGWQIPDRNYQLWRTNGDTVGLVFTINPFGTAEPQNMFDLNGTLFFVADDGNGFEVWKNTALTTEMVKDIQPLFTDKPYLIGVYNNKAYFSADNGTTGSELWSTDGTAANTNLVKDINKGNGVNSDPGYVVPFNGSNYFAAHKTSSFSCSLFKTDGTDAGTIEVKPAVVDDEFSANPYNRMKVAGGLLYFQAYTLTHGSELWKSDGTLAGTQLVKDISPGNAHSDPFDFIEFQSKLFFVANDGINGRELWTTDGTAVGTTLVKNINATGSAEIRDMKVVNNLLLFVADNGINGNELWVSDGTTAGTFLLKDINPGGGNSNINNVAVIDNFLYFTAFSPTYGDEPWRTDGTAANTVLFKDMNPGTNSSGSGNYTKLGKYIYFGSTTDNSGGKLWRTDGTIGMASLFNNVSYPFFLTKVADKIVFFALEGNDGFTLWSTDGKSNTSMITNFGQGLNYLLLDNFPVYQNRWFFWVDDRVRGQELWWTDGTNAGVYDIAPGPPSSYPRNASGIGNSVVFSAHDGTDTGLELYKLDLCNVGDVSTWKGIASNNWNDAANWCGGVPTSSTNVIIPFPTPNQPSLLGGTYSINSLDLASSVQLNLAGGNFTINGELTGEGTMSGSATSSLTMGGSGVLSLTTGFSILKNLTLSNNASLTLGRPLDIATGSTPGVLTLGTGATLVTNNILTLKSDITGTARVAALPVDGSGIALATIDGKVYVERFVGSATPKRAWRLLTSPLRNNPGRNDVRMNWQLGGTVGGAGVGNGTLITGPNAAGGDGLDAISGYSLKSFDGTNLVGVDNTILAKLFDASATAANKGYFIFVRGDRSTSSLSGATNTTFTAQGLLQTGDQTFATNTTADGFTLIGNPYASPVDFDAFRLSNLSSNIRPNYYFWDPYLNTVGGYVTVSYNGVGGYTISPASASHTQYIQSGQAIFVQTKNIAPATNAAVVFKETHKSANNINAIFRTGTQLEKLEINLNIQNTDGSWMLTDAATAVYHNIYSPLLGNEDAQKIINIDENVGLLRDARLLSIEGRPLIDSNDTLFINMSNIKPNRTYQFKLDPSNFDAPGLAAFLEDSYLNTTTSVSLLNTTTISFLVNANPTSFANRFRIVFRTATTLPVNFTTIKAYQQNAGITVDWNVAAEINTHHYEVEKSTDGRTFTKGGTVLAKANNQSAVSYSWFDATPIIGNNFYRIRAIENSGIQKYSSVVNVKIGKESNIVIYPNPVSDHMISIQLSNQPKGVYLLQLYNSGGQKVFQNQLSHNGGSTTQAIALPSGIIKGVYQLRINNDGKNTKQIVIH